jgi:zinc-binding alcohol dehydrogenase family protein
MKAVGYLKPLPIGDNDALVDLELAKPQPGPHDLRVAIRAVSVNPLDVQLRTGVDPAGTPRVLGFDAAGVVEAIGSAVTLFQKGDEVFYVGAMNRPGTNSEYHVVDERSVALKPSTLSFAESAALPLTSLTAWEVLFDRLGVPFGNRSLSGTLLIVNGAGGVGSMLTQMARRFTGLTVIATASRQETREWLGRMGAHHVIDHRRRLDEGLQAIGVPQVDYVASLTATAAHLPAIAEAIAPRGKLALIDDPAVLDIVPLKSKSVSIHWELVFTRTLYEAADMIEQHRTLSTIADLVDAGLLFTTLTQQLGAINAMNLRRAHAIVESARAVGKMVLAGFDGGVPSVAN